MVLDNYIPDALKARNRWLVWQYFRRDDKWTKVPLHYTNGAICSAIDPRSWCDYATALGLCQRYPERVCGLGHALGAGLSCIDLDSCLTEQLTVDNASARQVVDLVSSYTEISPGKSPEYRGVGRGLHAFVLDDIDRSRTLPGIELYGEGRYMTVTGNLFEGRSQLISNPRAIAEIVQSIDALQGPADPTGLDWSVQPTRSDEEIHSMCIAAHNGERFNTLWLGHWYAAGYTSQSEADYALIDMISFYTDSPIQIKTMFLASALGQRDKAQKRDTYVHRMIQRSFDRKYPTVQMPAVPALRDLSQATAPTSVLMPSKPEDHPPPEAPLFSRPYGTMGRVYDYIMRSSYMQMEEAAVVASLGLMAGICGRQYQCNGSGLNLYMMLLAPTGSGKDIIGESMDRLLAACRREFTQDEIKIGGPALNGVAIPPLLTATEFRGPDDVTGKGLIKAFHNCTSHSMICTWQDFSHTMKRLNKDHLNDGDSMLKNAILRMYGLSGADKFYQGASTASKDRDIDAIPSPALSILADATPDHFYENLTREMISVGLLNRFSIFHRTERTYPNPKSVAERTAPPPVELVAELKRLIKQVYAFKAQNDSRIEVIYEADAEAYKTDLEIKFRDRAYQKTDLGDTYSELWIRAFIKIQRMSALCAISMDPFYPRITMPMVLWAQRLVEHEITAICDKFMKGIAGGNESSTNDVRLLDVLNDVCGAYFRRPYIDFENMVSLKKYKACKAINTIPYGYLLTYMIRQHGVANDPRGSSRAVQIAVSMAEDAGILKRVTPVDAAGKPVTLPGGNKQFYWENH